MIKKAFFLTMIIIMVITAGNAMAVYFTIQLKNGNELKTVKYWDEEGKITFYTGAGTVSIPRIDVQNIIKSDGELGGETVYFSSDFLSGASDDEPKTETVLPGNQDQELLRIDEIKDRISVIETNLVNLEKNKQTYFNRREKYIAEKERSEARIERAQADKLTATDEVREKIAFEQSKVSDAEKKIQDVDDQIKNTAKMLENQKRIKARLEDELTKLAP